MELQLAFEAIGTQWRINSSQKLSSQECSRVEQEVRTKIEQFDKTYSRFRGDSLVSKMAASAGTYAMPEDGYALLTFYKQLYEITHDLVTPLIGNLLSDAGYDANYSFTAKPLSQPPKWDEAFRFTENEITVLTPAILDFGAAGKGDLVDLVGAVLTSYELTDFTIDAGGDIYYYARADTKLRVGLENPYDRSEAIGVAEIRNESICASSGARRKWGKYHHIFDPETLRPTNKIAATWVVAKSTMLADGLATALFFTEPSELLKHFTFSYAVLSDSMSLEYSRDFPAEIHTANA